MMILNNYPLCVISLYFHRGDLLMFNFGSCVFTARRYASAVYAMVVCLSVRPSQVGVLLKRLNIGKRKQRRTIAQGL